MELGKIKALLGIPEADTSQDILLQFAMDDVRETILNYCNLDELPEGLTCTAYRMVISISEGDTSTSFTSAGDALAGGGLKDYQGQLNRYRRVRW